MSYGRAWASASRDPEAGRLGLSRSRRTQTARSFRQLPEGNRRAAPTEAVRREHRCSSPAVRRASVGIYSNRQVSPSACRR